MKIDKNNSVYIIVYAVVMVVVVAAVLAVAAMVLQPIQNENIAVETKGALLASVGVEVPSKDVEAEYKKYITEISVPVEGGSDGASEGASEDAELKLYQSTAGGKTLYIVPVSGSGLWGPVWGYVAVEGDWSTISGVVFDHKGETPGLGAEITTPKFRDQFVGKKLFEGDKLVGITVLKGAGSSAGNPHAVDAISGGTITSRAVETMIRATLAKYETYIRAQQSAGVEGEQSAADAEAGNAAETTFETAMDPAQTTETETINTTQK